MAFKFPRMKRFLEKGKMEGEKESVPLHNQSRDQAKKERR